MVLFVDSAWFRSYWSGPVGGVAVTELRKRPVRVIYGVYWLHESLCVLEEDFARGLDAEVSAIKACRTLRQALEVEPTLRHTWFPDDLEDLEEDQDLDAPWDWSEQGSVADGDWPPMPDALTLQLFDPSDTEAWNAIFSAAVGAETINTTLNGEYLHIPQANEAALLAALDGLGIACTRDDAIVLNIGLE